MFYSCPKVFNFSLMPIKFKLLRSSVKISYSLSNTEIILIPTEWTSLFFMPISSLSSLREYSYLRLRSSATAWLSVSRKSSIWPERLLKLRFPIVFLNWLRSVRVFCSTFFSSSTINLLLRTPSAVLRFTNFS